ncbi:hypothetical protein ACU4GR_29680 [Methylobacterium oryzae CBMB20]
MPQTIFFSWQADTATRVGRNLIERALEKALGRIGADTDVEEAVRELEIDRDTKGVAGSPPIVDTIFKKIDAAAVFLPDLTFVGQRLDGRPTPNPNVLIEYGWALKSLSHGRVVPVMNTAFGEPTAENMPFDMRHLRNPILYRCAEDASEEERRQARERLAKELESRIRAVLTSPDLRREVLVVEPARFVPRPHVGKSSRFRAYGEALGILSRSFDQDVSMYLEPGPSYWLRVMPKHETGKVWTIDDLQIAARRQTAMQPLNRAWSGLGSLRGADGFGVFPTGSNESTYGVAYIFKTGEIWSIDTYMLQNAIFRTGHETKSTIYLREDDFRESLREYSGLLKSLGVQGTLQWIAGMEGVRGRSMDIPRQRGGYSRFSDTLRGSCMLDEVVVCGEYNPDEPDADVLRPFFEQIYESCGTSRPDWLYQLPRS